MREAVISGLILWFFDGIRSRIISALSSLGMSERGFFWTTIRDAIEPILHLPAGEFWFNGPEFFDQW
jgi:hypothetical protein